MLWSLLTCLGVCFGIQARVARVARESHGIGMRRTSSLCDMNRAMDKEPIDETGIDSQIWLHVYKSDY